MISFDTNLLVYVTASLPDAKARPARDLIARARSPVRNGYVLAFDNLSACPPVMGKTGCGTQKIRGSPPCSARFSPQPVFDPKIRDPQEFVLVIGNYRMSQCQCVSGNEQVVGADRVTGSLQTRSCLTVNCVDRGF